MNSPHFTTLKYINITKLYQYFHLYYSDARDNWALQLGVVCVIAEGFTAA